MDKVWYYMKSDRTKYGPYSDEEVVALFRQGIITPNDYIWMPDMTGWVQAGNSIYSIYFPNDPENAFDIAQL